MNDEGDNGSNAGDPNANGGAAPTDQGGQPGGNPNDGNNGNPGNQNGQPAGQGDAELAKYKAEVQRLNRVIAQNRRSSNQSRQQPGQGGEQGDPFSTPEGQYGIALNLATNQLRGEVERVFSFYPEIPAEEISRIRMNPWAFASQQAYISGDWEQALEDIEYALLDRAEALKSAPNGGQNNGAQNNGTGNSNGQAKTTPAQVNTNPNNAPDTDALPGSAEDENPWTMPMDKLEKKAMTELRRKQTAVSK